MELRHLRYFVAVAEELGFRRAAVRLGVSQPPVSQQIRDLETELGTALFIRNKRGVELTAPGILLLEEARNILSRTESLGQRLQRAGRGEIGRLAIAFFPSADLSNVFTKIIRTFSKSHPAVQLELHQLHSREQFPALLEHKIDIGFVRPPIDEPKLDHIVWSADQLMVALPANHRYAARSIIPVTALAGERYIGPSRRVAPSFFDAVMNYTGSDSLDLSGGHEVENMMTILSFVAADMGIAFVPKPLVSIRRPGVIYRPLTPQPPHLVTAVTWRKDDQSPLVRQFRALVTGTKAEHARS